MTNKKAAMTSHDSTVNLSRRAFFREFFTNASDRLVTIREEFHGRPQMRLNDLEQYPDEVIKSIVPVFNPNLEYQLLETYLRVRQDEEQEFIDVLPLSDGDTEILNWFNQGYSLWEIAGRIAGDEVPAPTKAYARVKTIFLTLTRCAVCYPDQSLVNDEAGSL